ncbi:YgaP family membrane protein [Vibrio sp. FJH11]
MTLENAVRVFAGIMVLVSVLLTVYVHSYFMWFTVFIGVNLIQSAYTGICPAAFMLKKLGFR